MNRNVSLREIILLGVLLILAVYYFVLQGPVAKETAELQASRVQVQTELEEAETKLMLKKNMEAALEESFGEGSNPVALPDHDNVNNIINELNTILSTTSGYNISFGDEETDVYVVRREIRITCKVKSYKAATALIDDIRSSSNGYLIKDVAISEASSRGGNNLDVEQGYSVSLTITSFEYKAA